MTTFKVLSLVVCSYMYISLVVFITSSPPCYTLLVACVGGRISGSLKMARSKSNGFATLKNPPWLGHSLLRSGSNGEKSTTGITILPATQATLSGV